MRIVPQSEDCQNERERGVMERYNIERVYEKRVKIQTKKQYS